MNITYYPTCYWIIYSTVFFFTVKQQTSVIIERFEISQRPTIWTPSKNSTN
jgi:hypothetical protein